MLEEVPAVFIREKHDDAFAHEWELYIWKNLASDERFPALEMFEICNCLTESDFK